LRSWRGAPGLSRTLLSQRHEQLERPVVIESSAKPDGRGQRYALTPGGHDLFSVCASLGEWGAAWLEIAPRTVPRSAGDASRTAPRPLPLGRPLRAELVQVALVAQFQVEPVEQHASRSGAGPPLPPPR